MRRVLLIVSIVMLTMSCASTAPDSQSLVPREDRYYLVSPLIGYPKSMGPTSERRIDVAHGKLLTEGDLQTADATADDLLGRNPDLAPATVLRAQSSFLSRDYDTVLTGLAPVIAAYPDYVAAQLLFGRSSEKLGNLVEALESYRQIEGLSELAQSRVVDLTPRAVEIMALRIEDALAKGHTSQAAAQLEALEFWAPDEDRTLEVVANVARATADQEEELRALRILTTRNPDNRNLEQRRAELELEIGDPAMGMRMFEELAERYPDDPKVAEGLVEARFLWRVQLLPPEAQALAAQAELTRGQFAVLVYWLFPEIRYGALGGARIANDILEHPNREQIVRVVNARILDIDPSLHRFEPYRPIERQQSLSAMLRMLATKEPPFACLGSGQPPVSSQAICAIAATCGLIESQDDCLPTSSIPGSEALELCRRTQELLGVQ